MRVFAEFVWEEEFSATVWVAGNAKQALNGSQMANRTAIRQTFWWESRAEIGIRITAQYSTEYIVYSNAAIVITELSLTRHGAV